MRSAVVLGFLAAMAAGPLAAQVDAPLRASLNSDIRSTQPGGNRDNNTDMVILHAVEGLVALDEHAAPVPLLAESVDVSPDGLSYTFRLRDGVTFHNGAPLTSAEVVWSLKRYLDPATQWRCLPDLNGSAGMAEIARIDAPDSRTVTLTLAKPTALLLAIMARPDCGMTAILHPSSVGSDGVWIGPVGTGPYRLGEWRKGQYIDLERFDGYKALPGGTNGFAGGKNPLMRRLRFVSVPDASAAKTALLAGDLDILSSLGAAEVAELKERPDVVMESAPTMGLTGFLMQTRDPLLRDARIRRAIALSIDAAEIVAGVEGGDVPQNPSPVPVASPFYDPAQSRRPPRDLAEARRLLAQAGYRGQPIRMVTSRRYPNVYDAGLAAQAMAAEAGIRIELDVLDWATTLDRYTRGDYQMMAFIYSARLDASLSYEMISGPKDTQPRKVWEDPQALDLIRRSMVTTDTVARSAIFGELFRLFMDQVPMIVLYNQPDYYAARKGVKGVVPWASPQLRLWNVSRS